MEKIIKDLKTIDGFDSLLDAARLLCFEAGLSSDYEVNKRAIIIFLCSSYELPQVRLEYNFRLSLSDGELINELHQKLKWYNEKKRKNKKIMNNSEIKTAKLKAEKAGKLLEKTDFYNLENNTLQQNMDILDNLFDVVGYQLLLLSTNPVQQIAKIDYTREFIDRVLSYLQKSKDFEAMAKQNPRVLRVLEFWDN